MMSDQKLHYEFSSGIPTYFDWLKSRVDPFVGRGRHNRIFETLNDTPYFAIMEMDRNRESDGISLRDTYSQDYPPDEDEIIDAIFVDGPCSMLEFLVALSMRMNYIYSSADQDNTAKLFWEIMENIGLDYDSTVDDVFNEAHYETAIFTVLHRTYEPNGFGNFFPQQHPCVDQRNVEVWYQMNQYLIEKMRREQN